MNVGGKIAQLDSVMEDTWTRVVDLFAEKTIECAFSFGANTRELTSNVPPHIHFERVAGSATFGGTRSGGGEFARIVQAANAYVWGLQAGEDFEKHADLAALGLVAELIGALYCVAPRYPGDEDSFAIEYSNETHVLKYGAQFVVAFQFMAPLKWVTAAQYLSIGGTNANLATRSS
jgi:hypothetical protein